MKEEENWRKRRKLEEEWEEIQNTDKSRKKVYANQKVLTHARRVSRSDQGDRRRYLPQCAQTGSDYRRA